MALSALKLSNLSSTHTEKTDAEFGLNLLLF
jgi:hypothetical protein